MKVWVVNHPAEGRSWCKVRVRALGRRDFEPAYVWAEWGGPFDREIGGVIVPRLPDNEDHWATNTDPLVIGEHMFFDYCKKGRKSGLVNLRPPNGLDAGDIILFGCKDGSIIVDTVFVVGARKEWGPTGIPWEGEAKPLARRVHFHRHAHEVQHPEVHCAENGIARSYRGRRDLEMDKNRKSALFCWVPFQTQLVEPSPMRVDGESKAYSLLKQIYQGKSIEDRFKGCFAVQECSPKQGAELFDGLIACAKNQGFGVAAEVALLSDDVRQVDMTEADALLCSAKQCLSRKEEKALCGKRVRCRPIRLRSA